MLKFNKKGRIPIIVLVMMIVALYISSILAFSLATSNFVSEAEKGYESAVEYNIKAKNSDFLGERFDGSVIVEEKEYYIGAEYIDVDVRAIID